MAGIGANNKADPRAAWILDSSHAEAHSEYALTAKEKEHYQQVIIDRTFIDEKGIRWIIDYKTTNPKTEETEAAFYDRMQQDEKQRKKVGEVVALILDRLDDLDKAEILAKVFGAFILIVSHQFTMLQTISFCKK